jgi:hypothetical protein
VNSELAWLLFLKEFTSFGSLEVAFSSILATVAACGAWPF